MVNLALSGRKEGAWPRARVSNIVGDGSSGKTLLALELIFWFLKMIYSINSKIFGKVKKAKVVYNNGEGVMDFPLSRMYGPNFEKMVDWKRSPTIESAGRDYLDEARKLKKGECLLYIIDSWDSFRSIHDAKIQKEKDEDVIKGYNLKKQQFAWKFFADACDLIDKNAVDATLIIISQTKSKIGVTFGKKQYRSGGDALNFYTHLVPWVRRVKKLVKTRMNEAKVFGFLSEINVDRSKVGLAFRTAEFRIINNHGIDDIGSMGMYLLKHKKKKWKGIKIEELNMHNFTKEVIRRGLKEDLQARCEKIWMQVEEQFEREADVLEEKSL